MMNLDNLADWEIPTTPALTTKTTTMGRRRTVGEFLRGPIPLEWLTAACRTNDASAIQVAMALWWEVGRRGSHTIPLTTAALSRFQDTTDRRRKARGIKALEDAGLVSVERSHRKNPMITVITQEKS